MLTPIRAGLAEGHQVNVIIHDHIASEMTSKVAADPETVPARHQRRANGHSKLGINGSWQADRNDENILRTQTAFREHGLEGRCYLAQQLVRTDGDFHVDFATRNDLLVQGGNSQPGGARGNVGHEDHALAGADPKSLGGPPPAALRARSGVFNQPVFQQGAEVVLDGRAGEPSGFNQIRSRHLFVIGYQPGNDAARSHSIWRQVRILMQEADFRP
ncbi:hypothetical protein NCCP2145_29400 [Pseudarthrobacter sp. NCCP-2145]|nr:hypothetical protein NCCP2145_29400 [Pseudarthrobacter sp. NCCP-2145]